jgi:hypothetical protein
MSPRPPPPPSGSEPVLNAFHRALDLVESEGIEACVMGGLALQVHAIPRVTFDVDLQIAAEPARVLALLQRARESGAVVDEPYLRGWTDELAGMRKVAFLVPAGDRLVAVDLFLVTTPFQRSAFDRRRPVDLAARNVPVVTLEDLLLFKLIANRRKDQADVVDLLAFGGPMDLDYVRTWARELGVTERLSELAREAGRTDLS